MSKNWSAVQTISAKLQTEINNLKQKLVARNVDSVAANEISNCIDLVTKLNVITQNDKNDDKNIETILNDMKIEEFDSILKQIPSETDTNDAFKFPSSISNDLKLIIQKPVKQE